MNIKWDRRIKTSPISADKPIELPVDYLRLVESTLTAALAEGLEKMKLHHPTSEFRANGAIYGDEVLLALTLFHGAGNLSASTVYASCDFDPTASKPGIEAILSACLDAAGDVFTLFLDPESPEKIAQLADHSLSALEEAPFEWACDTSKKIPVWVRIDKLNPILDDLTERWLKENDPIYKKAAEIIPEEAAAEEFLEERLEAIQKAKSGSGNSGGPITH